MLAATKQEISSAIPALDALFPLAAFEGVGENSRLGFARKTAAPRQGSALANSQRALRDRRSLARNTCRMPLLAQSPGPSNPTQQTCVEKALSNIPGVTSVAQTGPAPFPFFGHINETDTLTFNSPSAMTNFLTESSRTGLIPSTVSEYGFGPGVRLPGGLHSEGGAVVNGQFTVTSHIDLFNPNGGLAPLLGHVFADVLWGHILGRNQTKLDKGC